MWAGVSWRGLLCPTCQIPSYALEYRVSGVDLLHPPLRDLSILRLQHRYLVRVVDTGQVLIGSADLTHRSALLQAEGRVSRRYPRLLFHGEGVVINSGSLVALLLLPLLVPPFCLRGLFPEFLRAERPGELSCGV